VTHKKGTAACYFFEFKLLCVEINMLLAAKSTLRIRMKIETCDTVLQLRQLRLQKMLPERFSI